MITPESIATSSTANVLGQDVIPLHVPDLRGREREYLTKCIDDGWVSSAGPLVPEFENRIAGLSGRDHAVATSSGTAALHLALVALGIKPGDLVILPDWTFAASANAICHTGAEPLFVDVANDTWTLDPHAVRAAIEREGARIAGIMCVYSLGLPEHIRELEAIADEAGLPLIMDAAGALGASYRGQPAAKWGTAACFSFNGNKIITTGGGGIIVTDDSNLAAKLKALSAQARVGRDYFHSAVGWNSRMPNINAAVGLAQLDRLDEILAEKRRIALAYDAAIADRNDIVAMPRTRDSVHNNWLYSVRLASEEMATSMVDHLERRGVQARNFWRSLSAQQPYSRFPKGPVEVSTALSGTIVSLPSSSSLSPEHQARVLHALKGWTGLPVPDLPFLPMVGSIL